jgi:hypothetical protein
MNIVETIAPISIDNLKKYFTDKTTFFVINYKDSTLRGTKLLTYLSNLDIPCDINFKNCSSDECLDILKDYLHTAMIVNIPSLEKATIAILHQVKELAPIHDKEFIETNKEILNKWICKLESLTLYNMYIVKDETFKEFVDSFEIDESNELIGVNFISLLKHRSFYSFFGNTNQKRLKFYSHYFNDYMFKGKNMYSYWANENNPLFLLTYGIAEGIVTGDSYNLAKQKTIEELKNVAPVQ